MQAEENTPMVDITTDNNYNIMEITTSETWAKQLLIEYMFYKLYSLVY